MQMMLCTIYDAYVVRGWGEEKFGAAYMPDGIDQCGRYGATHANRSSILQAFGGALPIANFMCAVHYARIAPVNARLSGIARRCVVGMSHQSSETKLPDEPVDVYQRRLLL